MPSDWPMLTPQTQAILQQEALRAAVDALASQAEILAREMETGGLADRGGPDALRLLAALVRVGQFGDGATFGHA